MDAENTGCLTFAAAAIFTYKIYCCAARVIPLPSLTHKLLFCDPEFFRGRLDYIFWWLSGCPQRGFGNFNFFLFKICRNFIDKFFTAQHNVPELAYFQRLVILSVFLSKVCPEPVSRFCPLFSKHPQNPVGICYFETFFSHILPVTAPLITIKRIHKPVLYRIHYYIPYQP